jgi:hypothetical protein
MSDSSIALLKALASQCSELAAAVSQALADTLPGDVSGGAHVCRRQHWRATRAHASEREHIDHKDSFEGGITHPHSRVQARLYARIFGKKEFSDVFPIAERRYRE